MSAKNSINDAETQNGMARGASLAVGYRQEPNRRVMIRWGKKRGTRRARRRLDKEIIKRDRDETV